MYKKSGEHCRKSMFMNIFVYGVNLNFVLNSLRRMEISADVINCINFTCSPLSDKLTISQIPEFQIIG